MDSRTWQDNADEFAQLDRGEGWPFARLVACSVEKGPRGGDTSTIFQSKNGKVSANEFAQRARTSPARVLRYLEAWNAAAAKGWVTHSASLKPKDAWIISDPSQPWKATETAEDGETSGVYSGGKTKLQDIQTNPSQTAAALADPDFQAKVIAKMTTEQRQQVVEGAIKADPKAAEAAEAAVANRPEIKDAVTRMAKRDAAADARQKDHAFSENQALDWLAKIQTLMDDLLRHGHQEVLGDAVAYGHGLLDTLKVEDLTPEMFR